MLAKCSKCNWKGIPTYLGGERTYTKIYEVDGKVFGVAFGKEGSKPQETCPVCKNKLQFYE